MKHCVVSRLPKTCFGEASGEDGLPCLVITESILVPRKDVGIYAGSLCINGCPESTTKTPAVKLACSSAPQIQALRGQSKHCGSNNQLFINHFYEILRNSTQHSIRRPLRRFSTEKSWENQESPANLSLFTKPYLRSKADKKKQTNHAMSLQNPADSSKNAMELTSFTCLNLTLLHMILS